MGDLNAENYHNNSLRQYQLAQELLCQFHFSGNEKILDVGCGNGKITAELAQKVPEGCVVGLDLSPSMIEFAQKTYQIPNLSFVIGNGETFHVDETFDLVFSFATAHWFRYHEQAFRCVAEHLKPGGTFALWVVPEESVFRNIFLETEKLPKWREYQGKSASHYIRSSNQYREALLLAGFSIEQFVLEKKAIHYESAEELIQFVGGFVQCQIDLPQDLYLVYLQDTARIARTLFPDPKGPGISVPYHALTAICKLNRTCT